MATGIINPYAVAAGPNTAYRDAVLLDNPLSLWMLDETSGTVAVDQGSVGNDGTYNGFSALGNGTIFGLTAPQFGASGVTIPASAYYTSWQGPSGTTSIEFLSKQTSAPNTYAWIYKFENLVQVLANSGTRYSDWFGSLNGFTAGTQSLNSDCHNVLTWDMYARRVKWYVNGSLTNTGILPAWPGTWADTSKTIQLGGYFGNTSNPQYSYYGVIAAAALYSQVLSAAQITAHYNAL